MSKKKRQFQSLSGFLGRCNLVTPPTLLYRWRCFNPYRVFSGAATDGDGSFIQIKVVVSIPIGFSRALQHRRPPSARLIYRVSLPIGFSRALQLTCSPCYKPFMKLFQSLSGFLGRCNYTSRSRKPLDTSVSIPIGFSRALQQKYRAMGVPVRDGSIPIGFSRALQHKTS